MSEHSNNATERKNIRTRISKIQFPEMCPVCLEPAEDLVFVTVTERVGPESYETRSWIKRKDKTTAALEAARGITTFNVPTCLRHGSKSVRTIRTTIVAVVGFFIFFYPILFFLLQINLALIYSRPLTEPLVGAIIFIIAIVITTLYGIFPRALERKLRFENVSRVKDSVEVVIENAGYRESFLEMNELFSDIITEEQKNAENST